MGLFKTAVRQFASDSTAKVNNVFTSSANHGLNYKSLSDANPYANPVYRESGWQKFLSSLGFRTDKDRYLEGMNLQAQEYDNALLQKEYDEKYNDPLAQAERERAAGLNPNLTGNISAGESSPLADDGNPPQPSESDFGQVSEFANGVLNAVQIAYGLFSSGISVAGAVQDLKGKGIANRIASLDENNKLFDFAEDAVVRILPAVKDLEGEGEVSNYYEQLKKTYGKQMSRKQFKKFLHYATEFQNKINVEDKYFDKLDNRSGNRKSYFGTISNSKAYSEDDIVMYALSQVLSDLATDLFKSKTQNDLDYENQVRPLENENKYDYASGLDARAIANAESSNASLDNALKSNEKLMSDYNVKLHKAYMKIFNKLEELSDNGNHFASFVQLALSAFLLGNMPSLPSISRSSSFNPNTGSSKSSWSIK